ncbi:MAG: ParB/RepB/Spo0J family partition protein [Acutalibacteraceae bacterium]
MIKTGSKNRTNCQIQLIPQENIKSNPHSKRVRYDYNELEGLALSIKMNGMLQPITVRVLDDGTYELVAGERRLRASRIIGMSKIPSIVIDATDMQSAVFSVIENIQREDLDFFEEALAIESLITEHGLSQSEVAKSIGKAPSTLSNKLRLLSLTPEMRDKISNAGLTERHARALLTIPDNATRGRALDLIIERRLTVSETDKFIKDINNRRKNAKKPQTRVYKDMRIFLNTLNHAVDTIRKAGIEADTAKSETDEYVEYVIRIAK